MSDYLLTIDQGTTSSRAILFDRHGAVQQAAQQEFAQIYPREGWVEHDPEEIWATTLAVCRQVLADSGSKADRIAGIGITNQRETTVVWDRTSGEAIYNAIVWQDRRTAEYCGLLKDKGLEPLFAEKTGLLLDPYFSATKIRWILNNVPGTREKAEHGQLAFGTVDSFLLWRLTSGQTHATDASNASRTLLFDIHSQQWDDELLRVMEVPRSMLPQVLDCADDYGVTEASLFGRGIPIRGVAGDQQSALIGQACFSPGMVKSTYGTGCFMMMNTGSKQVASNNRLLSTVAYRLNGETTYAVEGSIFMAGATIQWLRDGLGIIQSASETQGLAEKADTSQRVYLVPAFTGLGAPYWDPHARGALLGLTRDSGVAEIVRAGLDAVAYQTRDLLEAMRRDSAAAIAELRIDGGMTVNDWFVQRLADTLGVVVNRPKVVETTALGAAFLAGLQSGVFDDVEEISGLWQRDAAFEPNADEAVREAEYQGWLEAVGRVTSR